MARSRIVVDDHFGHGRGLWGDASGRDLHRPAGSPAPNRELPHPPAETVLWAPAHRTVEIVDAWGRDRNVDLAPVEVYDITDRPFSPSLEDEEVVAPSYWFSALSSSGRWLFVTAAALVLGLVVGYRVGNSHRGTASPDAAAALTAVASSAPSTPVGASLGAPGAEPLVTTGNRCGTQTGPRGIQLGIEVRNAGVGELTFERLVLVLPQGGLALRSASAGSACGQIAEPNPVDGFTLPAGRRTTLLITLEVLGDRCPTGLSADFRAVYTLPDGRHFTNLEGFEDLVAVPFAGC